MNYDRKMFHPASIMLLFLIVMTVILMITTSGRRFFERLSDSKDHRSLSPSAQTQEAEGVMAKAEQREALAGESVFSEPVEESLDLTRFGVTGHNYYRLVSEGSQEGTCVSPGENRYLRILKDSGADKSFDIYNMCNLTLIGIHPGEAKLEYYSCNDSIPVGRKLPSYEELCKVYGEESDTMQELDSELLASFRVVVDEAGKITFTEEKR